MAHHIGNASVTMIDRQMPGFFIPAQHTLIFVVQLAKVMEQSGVKKAVLKKIVSTLIAVADNDRRKLVFTEARHIAGMFEIALSGNVQLRARAVGEIFFYWAIRSAHETLSLSSSGNDSAS